MAWERTTSPPTKAREGENGDPGREGKRLAQITPLMIVNETSGNG